MTALKTLTLRLRGSKTELEEMGEDVSDMATTTSQLQAKLLALTGGKVDIMLDANTFKNSTQILREMSAAWEDMNDIQRASALELMGGKRQANVLSALIQNFDTVENAIETSANSSGSALKENEKYLDSIQGKIDQFNNSVQSMWSNTLDSDWVKGIVQLGTELVKVIDKLGLIPSLLITIATISMVKNKMGPIAFLQGISDIITSTASKVKGFVSSFSSATTATSELTAATIEQAVANNTITASEAIRQATTNGLVLSQISLTDAEAMVALSTTTLNEAEKQAIINKLGLTSAATTLTMATLGQAVAEGKITAAEAAHLGVATGLMAAQTSLTSIKAAEILTSQGLSAAHAEELAAKLGLTAATSTLNAVKVQQLMIDGILTPAEGALALSLLATGGAATTAATGFAALWTALWPILALMAGVTVVMLLSKIPTRLEKIESRMDELNYAISDTESKIDSINEELETTQDRIAELLAMPSLSFVEQEELENLQNITKELESQLKLQETILKGQKQSRLSAVKDWIRDVWSAEGVLDKKYAWDEVNNQAVEDKWYFDGLSAQDALTRGFQEAMKQKASIEAINQYAGDEQYLDVLKNELNDLYGEWMTDTIQAGMQRDIITAVRQVYSGFTQVLPSLHELSDPALSGNGAEIVQISLERQQKDLDATMHGIRTILDDMSEVITTNDLTYGIDEEIDEFLDTYNAYEAKYLQIQGVANASHTLSSIFDNTNDENVQELKDTLMSIVGDEQLDAAQKQTKALEEVKNALTDTTGDYERLQKTLGIVFEDKSFDERANLIANYFTQMSSLPDSSTVEGISKQYQIGIDALTQYKDDANAVLAEFTRIEDGVVEQIRWDDLFKDGEVISGQISKVMQGADESVRKEFARVVQTIEDEKMNIETAIKAFGTSGLLAGFKLLEEDVISLNTDVFKNLGEDISGLIDTFHELSAVLGSVAESMDLVSQAEAEQAYSGSVSLETALKLMQTTDDWNKVLTITEGSISVNEDATENLVKDQLNLVVANLKTSLSTVSAQIAQNNMAASSDNLGKTIEESTTESVRQLAANMEYLGSLVSDFMSMNWIGMNDRAQAAKAASLESTKVAETPKSTVDLGEQQANLVAQLQMMGITATIDENGNVTYDGEVDWEKIMSGYSSEGASGGNKTEEEVADDAFQREMDYWENRIAANQAKSEQIQNEIDLLETQGKRAGEEYYKELIALEEERKELLIAQRNEALAYLSTQEEASEEWWEAANIINDLEGEIDDATASIQDFADAQAQIKWDNLEEITSRFSNLHDEISDLRDILQREDMFEDGNWTESGAAVLGTYVQDLEMYKNELATLQSEIADLQAHPYNEANAAYLKETYSIDSEQEYNDLVTQWNQAQRDIVKGAYDTADAIKDAYSQQVDAIEDAINEQIDAYNDYIDVVKEAYDAERELYEFKKDIQKQSKSIAETERRIASLSGSTNAADIAERRKLEAQLAEQRENINDSYYSHANDQRNNALDNEAQAYEESMNRYVEGLRETLEEQAQGLIEFNETGAMVTNEFLNGVTATVLENAGIILEKYEEVSPYMSDELKQPWIDASAQLGQHGNDLSVLNAWTSDSGYFGKFKTTASGQLTTPFVNGSAAASAFKTSTTSAMDSIASNVRSNVSNITSNLGSVKSAYSGIITTANQAKAAIDAANAAAAAGASYTGTAANPPSTVVAPQQVDNRILSKYKLTSDQVLTLGYGPISLEKFEDLLRNYLIKYSNKFSKAQVWNTTSIERSIRSFGANYVSGPLAVRQYAKGTMGTTYDEWAITDEPQFGDELVLVPGKDGNLSFMRKGTGVVPADLTANLMEWGQFTPDSMNLGSGVNINMINNAVNKPEFNLNVDNFLRCDNVSQGAMPELKQFVKEQMDSLVKQMNYSIKRFNR